MEMKNFEFKESVKRVVKNSKGEEYVCEIEKCYDSISYRKAIKQLIEQPEFIEYMQSNAMYYFGWDFCGHFSISYTLTKKGA